MSMLSQAYNYSITISTPGGKDTEFDSSIHSMYVYNQIGDYPYIILNLVASDPKIYSNISTYLINSSVYIDNNNQISYEYIAGLMYYSVNGSRVTLVLKGCPWDSIYKNHNRYLGDSIIKSINTLETNLLIHYTGDVDYSGYFSQFNLTDSEELLILLKGLSLDTIVCPIDRNIWIKKVDSDKLSNTLGVASGEVFVDMTSLNMDVSTVNIGSPYNDSDKLKVSDKNLTSLSGYNVSGNDSSGEFNVGDVLKVSGNGGSVVSSLSKSLASALSKSKYDGLKSNNYNKSTIFKSLGNYSQFSYGNKCRTSFNLNKTLVNDISKDTGINTASNFTFHSIYHHNDKYYKSKPIVAKYNLNYPFIPEIGDRVEFNALDSFPVGMVLSKITEYKDQFVKSTVEVGVLNKLENQ